MAEVVLQDYRQIVQSNETLTTTGSAVFDGFGAKEINLLINITASPTGTTPTITYMIQEVDPGDQTTVLGNSKTGSALNSVTTQIVSLPIMYSGTVKVTWTITGTTPSFTGVYASLISKVAGTTSIYDASGNPAFGPAGTPGTAVLSVQGVAGGQAIPVTMSQTDRTATGSITSTQNVAINSQGSASTGALVTGTWTGTLQFQASVDGTTWVAVNAIVPTTGASVTSTTANGNWEIASAGYQQVRVLGGTVATGSATVFLDSGAGTQVVVLGDPLPTGSNVIGAVTQSGGPWSVSGTVTANQGTPNSLANGWPVEITDGTNVLGTVAHPVNVTFTPENDRTSTGTITTNQNVAVSTQGEGNVGVLLGTTAFTGTVVFEGTIDGTNWFSVLAYTASTGAPVTQATANGEWTIPCAGYQQIRVRGNTVATGTATVALDAGVGSPTAITVGAGGLGAAGSGPVGNPIYVGGSDGSVLRALSTDNGGRQIVVGRDGPGVLTITNPVLVSPYRDDFTVGVWGFGETYRLRTGSESLAFLDNFDGSTVNTVRWTQSNLTMTQTQAQTAFTLNANATTTASTYSILTSTKSIQYTGEYGVEARFRGRLIFQANSVIEIGFLACATTATPTNGVFFRITSTGTQQLVINYNGTETTATIGNAIAAGTYYQFLLYMYGTTARLDILNSDNSTSSTTTLTVPNSSQGALIQTSHIPVAARVYNTATPPGTAPQIILSGVSVSQLDLSGEKAWEAQLGDMARFANTDPSTGAQLQTFANSAAPSTIAAASLSNTTAAYSTLGGLFAFNTPASAETDFILYAYQVPAGFDLMIWSVTISTVILGAQSTTTPTVLQWGLAVGSSAVSLATAGANPPIRQALGLQQAAKSASLGDLMTPGQLEWAPRVPIVCYGGKYVHVILRVVSGNLTANQINRGIVTFDGAFQ